MPFRFVHTADLHLDSPLSSLALRNGALADLVRGATRRVLQRIVDLCIAEEVDALLVAGDLYDGSQTSMSTALFLVSEMRRLEAAGIRVFVIRGNHDAQSQITRELTLPPNVHVFDGRGKPVTAGALGNGRPVVVHGVSFAQPKAPASLLPAYRRPVEDAVNIGMLHTSLAGSRSHDVYAPCSLADLVAHGFDYWALGHIHQRTLHHAASPVIVMPGNPQGRDINEAGRKSVSLVTVEEDGSVGCVECATAIAVFERLTVDLPGIGEWDDMLARVRQVLAAAKDKAGDAELVARLTLSGATPLAYALRRDEDLLAAELQAVADAVSGTWIEKVELGVARPAATGGEGAVGALAELGGLIERDVLASHAYRADIAAAVSDLLRQLPREARDLLSPDEAAEQALIAAISAEGSAEVLARLAAAAEPGDA
ncbi:DNA repair exonuclease [Rhizobium sp. TRM95111]|uniref:DNA repair exonuclease n=1 Tax=Rhizobium alarense TaxID=2846851 RepID=UPI001F1790DE|nr:DNA repair exonuclease [Rhizobium alarense]MCF3639456.1 DNA repair exonuclease [Rhizobium alarense]